MLIPKPHYPFSSKGNDHLVSGESPFSSFSHPTQPLFQEVDPVHGKGTFQKLAIVIIFQGRKSVIVITAET